MHINQLASSRFLRKEDCDPAVRVTIKTLTEENVAKEGEPPDMRYALHFDELDKPMVLNTTNGQLIAKITGSEETDEWSGQEIVLYNDPNVSFQGKLIGGIRVKAPKKVKSKPEPNPELLEEDDPDSIPF